MLPKLPLLNHRSATHRVLTLFFLLGFALSLLFGLAWTPGFVPSVDAQTARSGQTAKPGNSSASAHIIKRLQKQIRTLQARLAAAKAVPPTPAAFIEMVKVGNAGNVADSTSYGAVPYEYSLGK
jgi:hypothetical protein